MYLANRLHVKQASFALFKLLNLNLRLLLLFWLFINVPAVGLRLVRFVIIVVFPMQTIKFFKIPIFNF